MLYCMYKRPCSETTMCWGLECQDGWLSTIDIMSKKLEGLNMLFYPKFRVRIRMDQVKEKFGYLTCYHTIVCDPPKWVCFWRRFWEKVFNRVSKINFKMLEVLDEFEHDDVSIKEIPTKEEFEEEKDHYKNCSNVDVYEQDGKYYSKTVYHRYRKTHHIPTKHKWLYHIYEKRYMIVNWPINIFNIEKTHIQSCIEEILDAKAYEIINDAVKNAHEHCEICGKSIYDDSKWSPKCRTMGYIRYLCKDCANEDGKSYVMNGAVWQNGKVIVSKEDYEKLAKRYNDDNDEDDDE